MDVAGFRAAVPSFSDAIAWPDVDVDAALTVAANYIGPNEWTSFFDEATSQWVADRLVTNKILATNGPLSSVSGTETLKTVGTTTVGRDARIILATMEDPYLLTSFGRRYKYLVGLMFGGATLAGGCG